MPAVVFPDRYPGAQGPPDQPERPERSEPDFQRAVILELRFLWFFTQISK
jgi:hypothetical protein